MNTTTQKWWETSDKYGSWVHYQFPACRLKTRFFVARDIAWLMNGNVPKLNKDGYMILPYGHKDGAKMYPHLPR